MIAVELRNLLAECAWSAREWCARHVTMPGLHRRLDEWRAACELVFPPEWDTPQYRAASLRRIERAVHGGPDKEEPSP